MATYTVAAALVVAHTKNGVIHLYKGDVVPAGITPESLENLKELGFVQSAKEVDEVESDEPEREYPEGEPVQSWKVGQLTAWAKDHDVDLGEATKKDDVWAAVSATKA